VLLEVSGHSGEGGTAGRGFWGAGNVLFLDLGPSCMCLFVKILCCKLKIYFSCVSISCLGLCAAESVHAEGRDWEGKYPRGQTGFLLNQRCLSPWGGSPVSEEASLR
jgi:hypothetical protein